MTTELWKQFLFFGEKINNYAIKMLDSLLPISASQSSVLLAIVYLLMLYVIVTFAQNLKPIIKWIIVALIIFLVVGFFKI